MEIKVACFEKPGRENTEETLRIARQRAEELGIHTVVVASSRGNTAVRAVEVFRDLRVVVVSLQTGHSEPNVQRFTEHNREIVESKGAVILTTTHAFAGVSRAMRFKFDTLAIGEIIANVLRVFGQGMKVACEISLMAADSGLVTVDEDIIAIGGSGGGADTAVVLKPVNAQNFFDLKVKEVLCKPRL
ncbi:pyruvate kinase alpha/beta domain-containing protein [Chloroflexota bacterium]